MNFVTNCNNFDITETCDCGQAFRWEERNGVWHGVAFGKKLDFSQNGNEITFYDTDETQFNEIWKPYFSLDVDYASICEKLKNDMYLKEATDKFPGIRIIRQESWEALCSFIISQNNNIPRIKGIISRLCEAFGDDLGNGDYSFPTAEKIAKCTIDDLAPLRAGFRAKYIIDAAKKVAENQVNFADICKMPLNEANEELKKIKGVGDKVAQCTLLYGFNRIDAFPVDVWVKKIMAELYPQGLPIVTKGIEGIAQQYLFHWYRNR